MTLGDACVSNAVAVTHVAQAPACGRMDAKLREASKATSKNFGPSHCGQSLPPGDLTRFLEHAATGIIPRAKAEHGTWCSLFSRWTTGMQRLGFFGTSRYHLFLL